MMRPSRRSLLFGGAAAAVAADRRVLRLPRRIRVAILGFDGHTADIIGPLPGLPDVEIVAICDSDPKVTERQARNPRLAAAKRYPDYRRMLDSEKLDVVAVCNSNGDRAAAILECAARKLNVVAEKPLATELADLARVRRAVEENRIRLGMLLPMRYSPPYLALKKIVDSGQIGEVVQIGAQKSYKLGDRPGWMLRRASYGGTIPWIGIHMVDLMRFTSGREFIGAASFQGRIGDKNIGEMETVTASIFEMDNGGAAALRMDYFRPATAATHGDDRLRLAGTKGVAEYMAATGVTLIPAVGKPETVADLPAERQLFPEYLDAVYNGCPESLPAADIWRLNEIVLSVRDAAEKRQMIRL